MGNKSKLNKYWKSKIFIYIPVMSKSHKINI